MKIFFSRLFALYLSISLLVLGYGCGAQAQNAQQKTLSVVSGTVCDSDDQPLAGVEVRLTARNSPQPSITQTDAQGHFRFSVIRPDTYTLQANPNGYRQGTEGPFLLGAGDTKSITIRLAKTQPTTTADASASMQFSDEPQFTVAGVVDTTALGVHSSSRTMPNSNVLSKDTVALSHEGSDHEPPASQETAIRARLAGGDDADLRFKLAEIEERRGRSLDAEKDFQRAAELAPTEAHFFSWGAELLLHRAFEPAIEVFGKGNRLYPDSVRMLLGLGATYYAEGSGDEAAQFFLRASTLDPANPQPYLFLGRLLPTASVVPPAWVDAMKHFTTEHPENATARYLYGFALAKQGNDASSQAAESQLTQAIELDPHLGEAYLQLGILKSNRKDFAGAVSALQKAVEFTPLPAEAHYRLAEVYRRTGEAEKAYQETALYKQVSEQKSQEAERQRREIQQFIYTLRGSVSSTQPPTPNPH
jgi:tetratricopeptide (TPR) repeat protein